MSSLFCSLRHNVSGKFINCEPSPTKKLAVTVSETSKLEVILISVSNDKFVSFVLVTSIPSSPTYFVAVK